MRGYSSTQCDDQQFMPCSHSGVELAAVMADAERACLVLETGVNERFRYGRYRRTPESTAEAQAWEEAKRGVKCDVVTNGLSSLTSLKCSLQDAKLTCVCC